MVGNRTIEAITALQNSIVVSEQKPFLGLCKVYLPFAPNFVR